MPRLCLDEHFDKTDIVISQFRDLAPESDNIYKLKYEEGTRIHII